MGVQQSVIFSECYNPEELLHRQAEAQKIEQTFKNFHTNLFIYGGSGKGKTLTIKQVMKKYLGQYIYTSASDKFTALKVFKALSDVPAKSFSSLINNFTESLINKPRVLIIDEINKIYNITEFFNALNTLYRNTNVPIILISNKATLLDELPEDANLTLFFSRILFNSYNAVELKDIALQRLKLIDKEFPDDILKYICAKCREDGSARKVLYLVYRCILEEKYDYEFIDTVEKEIKRQDWEQWVTSLKDFEKRFLTKLVDIHMREITLNGSNGEIRVSWIQKELPDLSPQRISQLITCFQTYGILDTRYVNKGKTGGRYRLVSFSSDELFCKLSGVL